MIFTAIRALAWTAWLASPVAGAVGQAVPPPSAPPQACPVATDAQYGYSKERPVQVGGSPLFGAARQRKYLDALRGPEGQKLQYKRLGSSGAPDGTIVDAYQVTYDGLETPVGPYREVFAGPLLRGTLLPVVHIPFIAVDSLPSVHGGRAHWALPKAVASFTGDVGSSITAAGEGWSVSVDARARGLRLPLRGPLRSAQDERHQKKDPEKG